MKLIYIKGSEDYDASMFEEYCQADLETWNKIKNDGLLHYEQEGEVYDIECEALEFGEVDTQFIEFIKNTMIDYDMGKTQNFYVVEE